MLVESHLTLTDPRENKGYVTGMTPFRRFLTPIIQALVCGPMFNMKVIGLDNMPRTGGVVLAANHLTNLDVFPMQFAIERPIFYMGKAELFENPVMDVLLRNLGGFPVYRGARDEWALFHARRVLENGQVMGIFPEGHRSKGRGLRPGKTGAARLAIETNSPIVPMAVNGTQDWLKKTYFRTSLTIALGQPIWPDAHDSPLELTDQVMYTIAEMLPPHLRGVYAEHPKGF